METWLLSQDEGNFVLALFYGKKEEMSLQTILDGIETIPRVLRFLKIENIIE